MIRGAIFLTLGAGILVVPQVWWLFVAGLVVAAVIGWPERRRRVINLSPALGDSAQHQHYCATCDQPWHHAVARCVAHWAAPCPACSAPGAPAAEPPARSA